MHEDDPFTPIAATATIAGGPNRSLEANAALAHFQRALRRGTHWYVALLEAIGLWEEATERYRGSQLTYLIAGEALDWLLLADRLTKEARPLLPTDELDALLFEGRPPLALDGNAFRDLVGPLKYRCLLNFFYGVTVEEALFFALEEEARRHTVAPSGRLDLGPLFRDLYGAEEAELLGEFLRQGAGPTGGRLDIQQQKAFTYFLFKRRLQYCLPARVASDTKRGLAELRRQYGAAGRPALFPGRPDSAAEADDGAALAQMVGA